MRGVYDRHNLINPMEKESQEGQMLPMSQRRTGDLKLIQELNRSIVFETIRRFGPISRSEIAKKNRISPTTVTSAVNELMKIGFVSEGKTGASSGGRKPILVHFSPNSRYIIGVSVTNSLITVGKLNLKPQVCRKQSVEVGSRKGNALVEYLLAFIDQFLQELPDLDQCIGISIVTPGIVDYESGVIRYNSKLEWMDAPLKNAVETRFGLKAWLDNDTNAVALAEKEIGHHQDCKNLFYIMVGDGVGAGIVLNGAVFRGQHGGAGEFGHTTVERGGIRCECGNKGCLENYVSWPVILSRVVSFVKMKGYTRMVEMAEGKVSQVSPAILLEAAEAGDRLAIDILEDTASYLSTGIINIVNLFNPDLVILGGDLTRGDKTLISMVNRLVLNQGLKTSTNQLKIDASSLGENFELLSAANVVLHDQFRFSLSS